eukprot:328444-Rhodomonas_salina.1
MSRCAEGKGVEGFGIKAGEPQMSDEFGVREKDAELGEGVKDEGRVALEAVGKAVEGCAARGVRGEEREGLLLLAPRVQQRCRAQFDPTTCACKQRAHQRRAGWLQAGEGGEG